MAAKHCFAVKFLWPGSPHHAGAEFQGLVVRMVLERENVRGFQERFSSQPRRPLSCQFCPRRLFRGSPEQVFVSFQETQRPEMKHNKTLEFDIRKDQVLKEGFDPAYGARWGCSATFHCDR